MASTGAEYAISLIDWAKTRDPNGTSADVAELLSQSNEFIQDLVWQEANGPTGHRVTQRVGLPTVYYRQLGQGTPGSKSEYAQFDEAMSLCDAWSEVDCKVANLEADRGRFRFLEALGFIEAMSQKFATTFFYGDSSQNPTQFMGMSARYSTVNPATAANAQNVLDGGGTGGVNTSMWLLNSGPRSLFGIFPKGSAAGLQRVDHGEQTATMTAGYAQARLRVYQEQFMWDAGLALKDWRWCARIANIDSPNLVTESGAADILKLMTKAMYRLPSISLPASTTGNPMTSIAMTGRPFFVCNRTVREMLEIQAMNKAANQIKLEEVDGKKVLSFKGIPIRNCDALTNAEAQVV